MVRPSWWRIRGTSGARPRLATQSLLADVFGGWVRSAQRGLFRPSLEHPPNACQRADAVDPRQFQLGYLSIELQDQLMTHALWIGGHFGRPVALAKLVASLGDLV